MQVERHVRRLTCKFNAHPHASEKFPVLLSGSFLQLGHSSVLQVAIGGQRESCRRALVRRRLLLLQYNLHWEGLAHSAQEAALLILPQYESSKQRAGQSPVPVRSRPPLQTVSAGVEMRAETCFFAVEAFAASMGSFL